MTERSELDKADVTIPMIEAACEVIMEWQEYDIDGDAMRAALEAALSKASPSVGGRNNYFDGIEAAAAWIRKQDTVWDADQMLQSLYDEAGSATAPAATERQQVDAEHRICQHGRDAFADDCGMCELAGTNWAAPSAESSSATVCPAAKAMPDSPGFMTCCDQMRAGSRTDCTRSPCLALSAMTKQETRCSASFPHMPHDLCDGNPAGETIGALFKRKTSPPTTARTTYVPLTKDRIEALRREWDECWTPTDEEFHTLMDMANSSLLYAEEIDRLRSAPIASASAKQTLVPDQPCPTCGHKARW